MAATATTSVAEDVIQDSERWYRELTTSENKDRIAAAILSGFLVLLGAIILILASDLTPYKLTDYFIQYGSAFFFEVAGSASILAGLLYYFIKRRRESKYAGLRELIERAKVEGQSRHEVMLNLISQMLGVLPKIRDSKRDTAFFYGILVFILTVFLFPWNLFLAVAIWLYFRYEATSEFNREITRFDNWKVRYQS